MLSDADVSGKNGERALRGVITEARPACRSKELLVAVPTPDQTGTPTPEITLKLDTPLTGKPVLGDIEFDGVPRAFTRDPFMLTMDTDKSKITGLKVEPCAGAAPARKKGVTRKRR